MYQKCARVRWMSKAKLRPPLAQSDASTHMSEQNENTLLLATHKQYLQILLQQQAALGVHCPASILLEIDDRRAKIADLEAKMGLSNPPEVRSNLPRQPFFFGRGDELAQIAAELAPESRGWGMLIDGPGGIGKTALAIHAAELAPAEQFPLKIFVSAKVRELRADGEQPLADFALSDFPALLTVLGRELGDDAIGKSGPTERPRIVRDLLARQRALLVLDNLETLPEAERTRVFQFLDRLPASCKALVTSRRRSDVNARALRLDQLERTAAMQLLDALAGGNPLLARASAAERAQLYEVTQGNPLLMRWVVGQLGRRGSACRTLADACRFMERAPADNDPMDYVFGDLIGTLSSAEAASLAVLAHFTEPARVEWVAELAELAPGVARVALEDLRDRALLAADAEATAFLLSALVAALVRRRLPVQVAERGERLAEIAVALAEENGYQQFERFAVLEESWTLIAAALPTLLEGGNEKLQDVCDCIDTFLNFSGRWDVRLQLIEAAESCAVEVEDFYNAGWRAYSTGYIHRLHEQAPLVFQAADRAAEHWRRVKTGTREQAVVIQLRGMAYVLQEDYAAAIDAYQQVVELHRSTNLESEDVAIAFNDLAGAKRLIGDLDGAQSDYHAALRIAQKVDDRKGVALYTGNIAGLELGRSNWIPAEILARASLRRSEAIGRQDLIASNCLRIAEALTGQNKLAQGLPFARRAVEIYMRLGSPELLWAQEIFAECEAAAKDEEEKK